MTRSLIRSLALSLLLLALGACVSSPVQQAYNREMNSSIKRIAVLPMPAQNVRLFVFNNPGYSFGLIGMAIAEANRNGKENWLQKTAADNDFSHSVLFRELFTAAMLERGYELVWQDLDHNNKRDAAGLHKKYSPVTGADAQLDIGLSFVGYAAAGAGKSEPYRPTVNLSARLLSADGKKVLYSDMVLYHNVTNNRSALILEPDPKYQYPDFDDLEAAGADAIEGLRIAVNQTASALAKQL